MQTSAAMPGFSFEQIGAGDRLVHCERRGSLQRPAEKARNVSLKKRLHARWDIPVMHTVLQIYDGVC